MQGLMISAGTLVIYQYAVHHGFNDSDSEFKGEQVSESIALQTRLNEFKPRFHFLTSSHIPDELNEFVQVHPLDLLMIFPRKHGIFNLFQRKKSKNIIRHNQVPILAVHDMRGL